MGSSLTDRLVSLPPLPFSGPTPAAIDFAHGSYRARLAGSRQQVVEAQRLRFLVFNLELGEGLDAAYQDGRDFDEFDENCDHLVVEHLPTASIVGTYRLQTGSNALAGAGYYSAREFDLAPFESVRHQVVELGRACIHRDHRSADVLNLLWKGIAHYARSRDARYLLGCCSLTSQTPDDGWAVFSTLEKFLAAERFITAPLRPFVLPRTELFRPTASSDVPKLLRAYLAVGAKICAPPAIDREFKTIDFLTLLDLQDLHPRLQMRFWGRAINL